MSKIEIIPAKTETKVITVEPERYVLELTRAEAIYLAKVYWRFAGFESRLYDILRPLGQKFDSSVLSIRTDGNSPVLRQDDYITKGKTIWDGTTVTGRPYFSE